MPFKPGQSGNPAGKPKGTKHKSTLIREALARHLPEILGKLIEQAKSGDTHAAKLLLERALAPLKSVDAPVAVPGPGSGSVAALGGAVVARMLEGNLTPNEATALLAALAAQSKLVETDELTRRVEALEKAEHK
jgi:hypothetical protein